MNYEYEIERTVEDYLRRVVQMQDEYDEMKKQMSWNNGVELVAAIDRVEAEREEQARREAQERERLEAEAREQRAAIERAVAMRNAKGYVPPSDDDEWDDPDSQYYRRDSWLV
ncbi:hypothetical protein [Nocardia sp. NPDC051832]|uniref:hypothetical protein n=1 Tax=Nocardia sp. NPDC051832 TaxID=3155673 RepID=UPI0034417486